MLLDYSLSSTSCWVSPHHQHVDTGNHCHICTCFQLVITTHGRMSKITRRSFTSCPPHRQGILAPVAGLASRLFERLSSVCPFPVGTEEDAYSLPFPLGSLLFTTGLRPDTLAFPTSSADVSRFRKACECRKLQESPLKQDPFAFH